MPLAREKRNFSSLQQNLSYFFGYDFFFNQKLIDNCYPHRKTDISSGNPKRLKSANWKEKLNGHRENKGWSCSNPPFVFPLCHINHKPNSFHSLNLESIFLFLHGPKSSSYHLSSILLQCSVLRGFSVSLLSIALNYNDHILFHHRLLNVLEK